MGRIDTAAAAEVLTAILERPGSAPATFAALGEFDGIAHDPGRPGSWFRTAVPPSVTVGDWAFAADGSGTALEVRHQTEGIVDGGPQSCTRSVEDGAVASGTGCRGSGSAAGDGGS